MKYKVLLCLVYLCCISCQKRDYEWYTFFDSYQSLDSDKFEKFKSIKLANTFDSQLMYAMSFDRQKVNVGNLSGFDDNILSFFLARNLLYDESYQKAAGICEELLSFGGDASTGNQIFMHEVRLLFIMAKENIKDLRAIHSQIDEGVANLSKLPSRIGVYYNIRYLMASVKCFYNVAQNKKALATCHHAMHLYITRLAGYKRLEYDLNILRTKLFFNHLDITEYDILERSLEGLAKSQNLDLEILNNVRSDLLYTYSLRNKFSEFDSLENICQKHIDKLTIEGRNYLLISLLVSFDIRSSLENKEKVLSLLRQYEPPTFVDCNKNYYVFRLFEVRALKGLNHFEKADRVLNAINVPNYCDIRLVKLISLYINQIRLGDNDKKLEYCNPNEDIKILLENRELSTELFIGEEELHLDDFYAKNLNEILNLVYKQNGAIVPLKLHHQLLTILDDTRKRDWNREVAVSFNKADLQSTQALNRLNTRIRDGLRRCNDFMREDSLDAPFYSDLYYAYMSKDSLMNTLDVKPKEIQPLNIHRLTQSLVSENSRAIQFFLIGDVYWIVQYDGKSMYISKVGKKVIDEACQAYIDPLSSHSSPKTSKVSFPLHKNISFPLRKKYNMTYIMTDGMVSQIPFDDFEGKVNIVPNFDGVFTNKKIVLTARDFNIMTFSNHETRKSSKKQEISELYYDYEEGLSINNLLSNKAHIFHGKQSTVDNFTRSLSGSGLHLCTHSLGDQNNRLNSYFYLRDNKGQPLKVHLSQMYGFEKTPTFVNLASCSSGIGTNVNGLGVFSLSRPFFSKGTQTLIKTLWPIDDKANSIIMQHFYRHWISGLPVGEAILAAKRDMQQTKEYNKPYYWQGYVLEGNHHLNLKK